MEILPVRRPSFFTGVEEILCPLCVGYRAPVKERCPQCGEALKDYAHGDFARLRVQLLRKKGHLEGQSLGLLPSSTEDNSRHLEVHLLKFRPAQEEGSILEDHTFQPIWFETWALEVLGHFPFTDLTPGTDLPIQAPSEPLLQLKSIAYHASTDRGRWLAKLALLRAFAVEGDGNGFKETLLSFDIYKSKPQFGRDRGRLDFNDPLLNEYLFTFVHWSVLASSDFSDLRRSLDPERIKIALHALNPVQPLLRALKGLFLLLIKQDPGPEVLGELERQAAIDSDFARSLEFLRKGHLEMNAQELLVAPGSFVLAPRVRLSGGSETLSTLGDENLLRLIPFVSLASESDQFAAILRRMQGPLGVKLLEAFIPRIPEMTSSDLHQLVAPAVELKATKVLEELLNTDVYSPTEEDWRHMGELIVSTPELLSAVMLNPKKFSGLPPVLLLGLLGTKSYELQKLLRSSLVTTPEFRDLFIQWYLEHAPGLDAEALAAHTDYFMKAPPLENADLGLMERLLSLCGHERYMTSSFYREWLQKSLSFWENVAGPWPVGDRRSLAASLLGVLKLRRTHSGSLEADLARFLSRIGPGDFLQQNQRVISDLCHEAGGDAQYWYLKIKEMNPETKSESALPQPSRSAEGEQKIQDLEAQLAELRVTNLQLQQQNETITVTSWFQGEMIKLLSSNLNPVERANKMMALAEDYNTRLETVIKKFGVS